MSGQNNPQAPPAGSLTQQMTSVSLANPAPVPSVTLLDDPQIDFTEILNLNAKPPPAPASYTTGGTVTRTDAAQETRIQKLDDNLQYPVRSGPHFNRNGTVMTNHFRLEFDQQTTFYEYQITNIPENEKRAGKKRYMNTAIQSVPFLHNNRNSFATDHVKTIISWVNLHKDAPGPQVHVGNVTTGVGAEWRLVDVIDRNTTSYLNLHYLRQVDIQGLRDFSATRLPTPATANLGPAENALNIIMTKCIAPRNTLQLNEHKFYVKDAFFDISTGTLAPLRGLRGYAYRVKPGMGGILLNVGPATSAFWRPLLVNQVLSGGLGPFGGDEMALKGVRVYITYERGSTASAQTSGVNDQHSRIKIIRGFGDACNVQTFEWVRQSASGQNQVTNPTVEQYQLREYQRRLASPTLRAVNVGTITQPTWIAPEHLRILPDQIYAKVIPDLVARNFHAQSCRPPADTRLKIETEGLSFFPIGAQSQLINCPPIRLHPAMLKIPAASLSYSRILYSQPRNVPVDAGTGRWNLDSVKFLKGNNTLLHWRLLVAPGVSQATANDFIAAFNQEIQAVGVCNTGQGSSIPLGSLEESAMRTTMKNFLKGGPAPHVVVLLLRSRDVDAYSSFKYLTDKVFVLQSICASAATFEKQRPGRPRRQYMANIPMKANLKRAGINHSASGVEHTLNDTLVLGADVTHPGSGALQGTPSIAAVVGSLEVSGGRFMGQMQLQTAKQETISRLGNLVLPLLSNWCEVHRKYPKNVLYYRDGVSTSQFDQIIHEELPEIKTAFQRFVKQRKPKEAPDDIKLTAVIVSKRHSTRFFPNGPKDAMPGNGNCRPGTLVDSVVTSPYFSDFYLQSHNGIKGAARPCHYFVLQNEMGLTTQALQTLTHNLCHTYVRATLGVSYAAPAYYADRLCERGRAYLREWYSPSAYWRRWYHDKKHGFQEDIEKKRARLNQGTAARARHAKKTDRDREDEKRDAEALLDAMKECMKPDIEERWSQSQDDEAGANGRLRNWSKTMYWM